MRIRRLAIGMMCGSAMVACSHSNTTQLRLSSHEGPMPRWVTADALQENTLCGLGVAGPGYDHDSPYPLELSQQRALQNLTGILGTQVQEAIIDSQNNNGTDVQFARLLKIDDALLTKVGQLAKTDYWLDTNGEGPYGEKNFTYAHACVSVDQLHDTFHVEQNALQSQGVLAHTTNTTTPPAWLTMQGKQPGGRLCAVGYSMPAFFSDQTFQTVVDDIRGQLTDNVQTLVSSYYQEATTDKVDLAENMTVATTDAISKGVIVTTFWHDRDGVGPYKQKMTTYGWGCVYPMDIVHQTFTQAAQRAPTDEQAHLAQVQQRAEMAVAGLDAEAKKHGPDAPVTDTKQNSNAVANDE